MAKATQTGRKVYLIKSGVKTMRKFLGKKINESYFTGCIKRMVDSSAGRFKCSVLLCETN
jgi:hypothetical protein